VTVSGLGTLPAIVAGRLQLLDRPRIYAAIMRGKYNTCSDYWMVKWDIVALRILSCDMVGNKQSNQEHQLGSHRPLRCKPNEIEAELEKLTQNDQVRYREGRYSILKMVSSIELESEGL
jgi:hypothetical protein